jgi:hypothetical protein
LKIRRREPAGFSFSSLIAHDREHRLNSYGPVTLEQHRPRSPNSGRSEKDRELMKLAHVKRRAEQIAHKLDASLPQI